MSLMRVIRVIRVIYRIGMIMFISIFKAGAFRVKVFIFFNKIISTSIVT